MRLRRPGGGNPKELSPLRFPPPGPSPFLNPDWGWRMRRPTSYQSLNSNVDLEGPVIGERQVEKAS